MDINRIIWKNVNSATSFLKNWNLKHRLLFFFPLWSSGPLLSYSAQQFSSFLFPECFPDLDSIPNPVFQLWHNSIQFVAVPNPKSLTSYSSKLVLHPNPLLTHTFFLAVFLVYFLSPFSQCQNQGEQGHQNHRQKCSCYSPQAWLQCAWQDPHIATSDTWNVGWWPARSLGSPKPVHF